MVEKEKKVNGELVDLQREIDQIEARITATTLDNMSNSTDVDSRSKKLQKLERSRAISKASMTAYLPPPKSIVDKPTFTRRYIRSLESPSAPSFDTQRRIS